MLNSKSFIAVDFGAGSLKLAEFEINEVGGLKLKQYGLKSLGLEGAQESTREAAITKGLQEILSQKTYLSKGINVCAPGFHVFSKFVKLPQVDTSKVTQIIQYEAQQNVPFPLDEVVWDYQILGTSASGELEVLLVAIKTEIVEGLFRVAESAGLRLQLADVSSAALCNSFRYNYGDLEGCTMLLDIGAKTSNLLFFEKGKIYSRSINLGANSITQDFGNEAKMPFAAAEQFKISDGFVSLGGAYEEPENPKQAQISKIARQFMTRLHIQVNQTIQFYRGQQGGTAPSRLFLSGGASIMPYTAQFFAEKLNVPVEYFNPFKNIQIDPSLNLEELAAVAHSFGEVVGLGLRNLAHCPVELNLMPKSSIQRQEFARKKPYFIAAIYSLAFGAFAIGLFYSRQASLKNDAVAKINEKSAPVAEKDTKFKEVRSRVGGLKDEADSYATLTTDRYYWGQLMTELRKVLISVEKKQKEMIEAEVKKQALNVPRVDVGLWVEQFDPTLPEGSAYSVGAATEDPFGAMDDVMIQRYHLDKRKMAAEARNRTQGNSISEIACTIRAVSMRSILSTADAGMAYLLAKELGANDFFIDQGTELGQINLDSSTTPPTYVFTITLKLKHPFKL